MLLAALIVLSVVAGSIAFTGSTVGISDGDVSAEEAISPTDPGEDSTVTFSFNYSFSNVDTSGTTTLELSTPSDFTVESTTASMTNASGAVVQQASVNGNADGIEVTASPSTSTVYLNGTVDITTPSVDTNTDADIDITGDDGTGTGTLTETIIVQADFAVSDVNAFSPTTVDENTDNKYTINYSFTGVNTTGTTDLSISTQSDLSIKNPDIAMLDASGNVLDRNDTSGTTQTVSVSSNPPTDVVYVSGILTVASAPVDRDTTSDITINGTDNDGDDASKTEQFTIENTALTASTVSSFSPNKADEQTTNQHAFNYSFTNLSTGDTTFELSGPSGSTITDTDLEITDPSGTTLNATPDVSGNSLSIVDDTGASTVYLVGTVNLTSPEIPEDQEDKTYDVTASANDPGGSASVTNPLTVEFVGGGQPGDPELESAIQYVQSDDTPAVEVAFSEDVENFRSNFELYVEGEGQLTGGQVQVTSSEIRSISEARGRAVIVLDQSYSSSMTLQLNSGIQDTDGNVLVSGDTGNTSVRFAPTSVAANEDVTAYQGANVSIVASASNTGVVVEGTESDTDDYFFDGSTGTNSRIFVFSTADRNAGDYEADIDGEGTADITVRGLGLAVNIDDRNVTNLQALEGTVEARSGGRPVRLEFLDENGDPVDEVDDRIVSLSGQGEHEFSYDLESLAAETGEYLIRATDTTSGVSVESDTVVVREAGDTEATFPGGTITEARGDVATIPIELANTREATLTIGGENLGFESNVTVRDDDQDGEVTVYFNTYAASTASEGDLGSNNDVFSVGDDDEVVSSDVSIGVSNLLDAESYDMSVSAEGRETDVDLLVLEPRDTTAIRTWTAPQNRYGDLDAAGDVREGDGGWLTRTDEVAVGDTVVYEIQASGLEGPLDARNEDTVTSEFYDFANGSESDPAAQFAVAQENPGPNQNPLLLRLNGSNSRVVADSQNNSYYVVTRTGADGPSAVEDDDDDGAIDPGETDYGQVSTDDDLRASFTIFGDDENDLDLTTDGDDEVVETTHSLTEAELSMSEPFNVTEVSGQEVFGEATVAPGTEIRVRVRSGDNVRPAFLKTAETTVDGDGQFLVTLSFNDTSPGDRYNVIVDDTGPASELSVEGTVQPVIQTPTTDTPAETTVITSTSTPTTTTSTPTETTTSAPVTTTTEIPTVRTPTTTPGFGVVAALVALAAAAALALRRE
ncbi:hypothetical protein GCM10008995_23600 [Halobellus salinus]|uniref:PGF-CTERM sorting domain-containing protein n=1 Tax=Halobellus salinus TaxID=931585 RepID=A0A830ED96_9EURY|nr:hypothetical protein GCM10008995_23600 [Halobellus salinus]